MKKTLIQNGNIVLEDQMIQGDLLIENGKIAQISDSPIDTDGCEVIQAAGKMILPGMIDTHAHLSDPGPYNYREDWLCASKSAASGGITTIVDMPLPSISVLDKERFDMKREVAEAHSVVDFALWGGACPKNIDKIEELDEAGCVGYKSFMCFATDEYPQMTDGYMVEALKSCIVRTVCWRFMRKMQRLHRWAATGFRLNTARIMPASMKHARGG